MTEVLRLCIDVIIAIEIAIGVLGGAFLLYGCWYVLTGRDK